MASALVGTPLHQTGTTGTYAAVSTGDTIILMVRGAGNGHATATDSSGAHTYTERGFVADGNSGFMSITCLAYYVSGAGYTPSITIASGTYFDAYTFSGLTDPSSVTPTTGNTAPGGTNPAPITPAVATPSGTVMLAIGYVGLSDQWTGWYQGSGGNVISGSIVSNPGHSAAQANASGYQLAITAGTYNPGITQNTNDSRTCVLAVFFQEAGGGGGTRPVKMAGEWGGYAGSSGGFAGRSRHGLHIPSRLGDQRMAA